MLRRSRTPATSLATKPLPPPEAGKQLTAMGRKLEIVAEKYNAAKIVLAKRTQDAKAAKADVVRLQRNVHTLQGKVKKVAVSAYQKGTLPRSPRSSAASRRRRSSTSSAPRRDRAEAELDPDGADRREEGGGGGQQEGGLRRVRRAAHHRPAGRAEALDHRPGQGDEDADEHAVGQGAAGLARTAGRGHARRCSAKPDTPAGR